MFNTLDDLSSKNTKNTIRSLFLDFFNSFLASQSNITPVAYSVKPRLFFNSKSSFNCTFVFYAPPSSWLCKFSELNTASSYLLALPHRYFVMKSVISENVEKSLYISTGCMSHDFLSFKQVEQDLYKHVSPVPLPNHNWMTICTDYNSGTSTDADLFSHFNDLYTNFLFSNYNSDYSEGSFHYTKAGYLLLKYLDLYSPSTSKSSWYSTTAYPLHPLLLLTRIAKSSHSFADYCNQVRVHLGSSTPYGIIWEKYYDPDTKNYVYLYDLLLKTWSETPDIWSSIPVKEYKPSAFRKTNLAPISFESASKSYLGELIAYDYNHCSIHYNLEDLISTLDK